MMDQNLYARMALISIFAFLGFLSQTGVSSEERAPESAKDTTWLTYVVPNEYSFQYPKSWEIQERWKREIPANAWPKTYKNLGFEIVKLLKHDCNPCKNETCAMCPNSAYISLSIQPKDSLSLFAIAHKSTLYEEIWRYSLEKSNPDEYGVPKVIKLELIMDGYPATSWFFDYKDNKYANLYGSYSSGKDSTLMASDIKRILESFKVLE